MNPDDSSVAHRRRISLRCRDPHVAPRRPRVRTGRGLLFSMLAALSMITLSAVATTVIGTGPAAADPGPPPGKTYRSTAVTGTPIPGGGPLTVTFPERGHIALWAGCNRHIGAVTVKGSVLTISALASTRMACVGARAGADAWLAEFASKPLSWYSVGQALILSGPTHQVLLIEGAP